MAILQGSEVAYVERALVRAPATFLGYEARKEGHHFRSCKPGLCLAFVLLHALQLLHGAIRRLFRGPRNKKSGQDATFLRLRIVGWCQNADRGLKMQSTAAKRPFSALREWKRVRNRKKVAETSGFFVFAMGGDCCNAANLAKIREVGNGGNGGNGDGDGDGPG